MRVPVPAVFFPGADALHTWCTAAAVATLGATSQICPLCKNRQQPWQQRRRQLQRQPKGRLSGSSHGAVQQARLAAAANESAAVASGQPDQSAVWASQSQAWSRAWHQVAAQGLQRQCRCWLGVWQQKPSCHAAPVVSCWPRCPARSSCWQRQAPICCCSGRRRLA